MARILITGASGFIGGYLVAQALRDGHDVTAAVRANSDRSRLGDPKIKFLELSLASTEKMSVQLQKAGRFDWVIHNAGVTKTLSKTGYREGNTENTIRLTKALQESKLLPDKFLFVSSLAALGTAEMGSPMVHAKQLPKPITPYGESKYQAEQYLESLGEDFPWVVVQPTAVYGPWERDILTYIRMANMGVEIRIGSHLQKLSFVHAADAAKAIFLALENPKAIHRKYIISDGKEYNTEDLSTAVKTALGGKKTLKIKLPIGLVRQVAGIAELIGRWQNKPSPLSRDKIPELAAENWHCDASPLHHELNFKPSFDLYQGMENTIFWYKKQGWL